MKYNHQRESGQAAVESALVMPLMVFMCLGIVQLTMLQHAKLMTDYAAFQAARAGTVWNGNNERMHDAAVVALLPTMGHTASLAEVAETWEKFKRVKDVALAGLPWGVDAEARTLNATILTGLIRVDTVNPAGFSLDLWKLRDTTAWKELDFDGPDAYPEVPGLESFIAKFFNLSTKDTQEDAYRRATLLQIRLRYWYEMRVPFANWVIFLAWYASNANVLLSGAIERSSTTRQNLLGSSGSSYGVGSRGRGLAQQRGFDTVIKSEMLVLWGLATGSSDKHYFFPLSSTYSMRMQSNFHRKWLMHQKPGWAQ